MRAIGTLFALAALALAGCATTAESIVTDTFCLSAKKIRWSTSDTPETIRQAEIHNRTIDLRCGIPGRLASK